MSLQPKPIGPIPAETARVAQAAFPKGNRYTRMRDALGVLFTDEQFAALFASRGQPAAAPARLALITIRQFAEGLADRQAAEAVRSRIDWKYALSLELTDAGCAASVLSEVRDRLIAGHAEAVLFETMVARLREAGLLKARGRQRTDSTHVFAAVRILNRLECVGETLRRALNTLAVVAPDWLQEWVPTAWFERSGRRFEEYRRPAGRAERYALAATIGQDGVQLLALLDDPAPPPWLANVPAVDVLRRVWQQQYRVEADSVRWCTADELPPATDPSVRRTMLKRGTARSAAPSGSATKSISRRPVMTRRPT